ncbi:MAG: hypothetical protein EOP56_05995 [Sphingobacteriales bacterium]|nr:MAG: hypothetical protein EOP56_05995 [Sphingobacteriales bacterium]
MGLVFVILIHLIGIFALSCIIAFVAAIATYLLSGKEKRRRKIFFSIISPFIGLYTFYFAAGIGSIIVSYVKDVDIGTGDLWYVPLTDKCQLTFIDVDEQAFIEYNNVTVISNVSHLQQSGSKIYVETYEREYFLFNAQKNKLQEFLNENEFRNALLTDQVTLKEAPVFYSDRRSEVAGFALIIAGVVSLATSLFVLHTIKKVVLKI